MPQLVPHGSDLLRINTQKNSIEYSSNGGRTWLNRFCMSSVGTFRDLLVLGTEVFAATSKGLYWRGDLDHAVQQFRGGGVPLAGDRRNGVAGYHHKVGDIVRLASEIKLLGDN